MGSNSVLQRFFPFGTGSWLILDCFWGAYEIKSSSHIISEDYAFLRSLIFVEFE